MNLQVTVVGWGEERDIAAVRDTEGVIQSLIPVAGSDRAYLDLAFPNGATIRVGCTALDLEQQVLPLLQDVDAQAAMLAAEAAQGARQAAAMDRDTEDWVLGDD